MMRKKGGKWRINAIGRRRILVLLLLIALVVVVVRSSFFSKLFKQSIGVGKVHLTLAQTLELDSGKGYSGVHLFSDQLYVYDSGSLSAYLASEPRLEWSQKMKAPLFLEQKGDLLLVCEYERGNVYTFGKKGKLISSKFGLGRIAQVKLLSDGRVLVLSSDEKKVVLLSADMASQKIIPLESGRCVQIDVNEKAGRILLQVYDESEGSLQTILQIYKLSGDFEMSIKEPDLAIEAFLSDEGVSLLGKKQMVIYDDQLIQKAQVDLQGLSAYTRSGDELYTLSTHEGQKTQVRTFNLITGKQSGDIQVEGIYDKIAVSEKELIFLAADKLTVYSKKGHKLFSKQWDQRVVEAHMHGSDHLFIALDTKLEIYNVDY